MWYFWLLLFPIGLILAPAPSSSFDLSQTMDNLQKTYQQANDWQAQFSQTTFVELLGKNVEKKGVIQLKKPAKLRIQYNEEFGKIYTSNGKKLWIFTPGDSQVEVFPKMSKIMASEALTFLNGLGDIQKEFFVKTGAASKPSLSMMQNKNLSVLELIPRNADSVLKKILLGVEKKSSIVQELTIFNASGNKTHYTFTAISLNAGLNDNLFEFVKPDGVREVKGKY